MAEVTKNQLITNSISFFSDFKTHFSHLKTRKSTPFIYGLVLVFVFFTVFLAFSFSSSPWFISTSPADESYRSHFSSVYSYFFHNSTSQNNETFEVPMNNSTPISKNLNETQVPPDKVRNFEQNNSTIMQTEVHHNQSSTFDQNSEINTIIQPQKHMNNSSSEVSQQISPFQRNQSSEIVTVSSEIPIDNTIVHQSDKKSELSPQISSTAGNQTTTGDLGNQRSTIIPQISQIPSNSTKKGGGVEVKSSDLAALLSKNQVRSHTNDSVLGGATKKQGNLVGCDLYNGEWVKDESYPLYKPGSCKLIDEQFNCFRNGRPDNDYLKLKWKPNGCTLPRLNAKNMLKLLRGKRLVFVGDSINRNMWQSLVCILKNSVKYKKKVYETFGRHHFHTEASYSFVFKDYNFTVEFFVSPFLVQQWEIEEKNGATKETLRLDVMVSDADQYKNAEYIVFNTGHWWTHYKTSKGEDYYQEGSHVYKQLDVKEAFRRAITTWARWVDTNVNPQRTHVIFRGYSASHFHGGQWNSGGQCDSETEPIRNKTYLTHYPWKMKVIESIIKGMKTPVSYLNVTRLTDYRKDGHPSIYRKHHSDDEKKSPLKYQDCSHWCLPGVPDSWNELLYAELLRKQFKDRQQKNKT